MKIAHDNVRILTVIPPGGKIMCRPHTDPETGKLTMRPVLESFEGNLEECQAERDRLNLADPRGILGTVIPIETNTQRATALFMAQPEEVRTQFLEIFRIINLLKSDADKAIMTEAVAVPEELQPLQAQLAAILRA